MLTWRTRWVIVRVPCGSRKVTMSPTLIWLGEMGSSTTMSPGWIVGRMLPVRTVIGCRPKAAGTVTATTSPITNPQATQEAIITGQRRPAAMCRAALMCCAPPR